MFNGRFCDLKVAEHATSLKEDAKPFKSAPCRSEPAARQFESFEPGKNNTILVSSDRSYPNWLSPFIVPKKDGQLRFYINYCKLSEMILKDSYSVPCITDYIDSLGQAKIF